MNTAFWSTVAATTWSEIPTSGLSWEWILNGNSNDTSGNGNNGTDTSITYTSDYADFNGSTSEIDLWDIGIIGNTWTISANIYADDDTRTQKIFSQRPSSGDANEVRFQFAVSTNFRFNVLVIDQAWSTTWYKDYFGWTTISTWTWYHILATWNGTTLALYLDGVAETLTKVQDDATTQAWTWTTRPTKLGELATVGWDNFDWRMKWVRTYTRVLTSEEITTLANEY